MAHMDRILRTTTPIKYPGYRYLDGNSTGFFYRTVKNCYLVTARHCLFQSRHEPGGPFKPEKIAIRIRNKSDHRKSSTKEISIYDESGGRKWIEPYHHEVDVAALPVNVSLSETGNTCFGSIHLDTELHPKNVATPGEPAIVAGYPLMDSDFYSPILRNALIASALDVDYDAQPYFLVDSNLHEGTSGSPVFIREVDENETVRFSIIGVHSGRYDQNNKGSEDLNRVWFLKHLYDRIIDLEPDHIYEY